MQDWKSNEALFTHDVQVVPNNAKANYNLGVILMNKGESDKLVNPNLIHEAKSYFDRTLQIDPNFANAYINMAYSEFILGNFNSSIAYAKDLLILYPNDARAHELMGNSYHALKRHPEAINSYLKALNGGLILKEKSFSKFSASYKNTRNDKQAQQILLMRSRYYPKSNN